eukprot:jgi/Tetstr1/430875/TSEL_020632.t1
MALRDYVLADASHTHSTNTFTSGYCAQPAAVSEWTEPAADYDPGRFFGAREQHFHQPGPSHFWNDPENPRPASQCNDFQGPQQSARGIMPSEGGGADLAPSFAAPFPPDGPHYTADLHATDHQRSSNSDSCMSLKMHVTRKGAVSGDGSDGNQPATHLRRRPAQSKEVKKAKKARAAQKYRKDKSERMDFLETQNRKLMERVKQLEQQLEGMQQSRSGE